ncbi:UNKNOWN [Stylonychia lemnae]|uniref:Uncharacterized protein n=1 Tax=Stylonychia lemnae TaxID=5949 RepID=A0A078A4U6_STYLE|nr:UNKNOWN [Stylonychia lemnae]|eukprot:CDW76590.1 UNKNOWN [Stylonychia lemnae]
MVAPQLLQELLYGLALRMPSKNEPETTAAKMVSTMTYLSNFCFSLLTTSLYSDLSTLSFSIALRICIENVSFASYNHNGAGSQNSTQLRPDQIPVIVLSITKLEYENAGSSRDNTQEPLLCYVYLGEKIQDVRGVSRDETRIKFANASTSNYMEILQDKIITIHSKQSSTVTLGYLRIPIGLVMSTYDKQIKGWLPLFPERDHDISLLGHYLAQEISKPRIYVDLRLAYDKPQKQIIFSSPSVNPFKTSQGFGNQPLRNTEGYSQSPIENQDDLSSSATYEEISENITLIQGRPQEDPQRLTVQSANSGQQIFRKKKKMYTQSANPNIQLVAPTVASTANKQQPAVETNQPLIKEELLIQLPPVVDKITVKRELVTQVDEVVQQISDLNTVNSKELTSWYTRVKQIQINDNKDLIVNDQRQAQLNQLQRDTIALQNFRKEQESYKQQLDTQVRLLETHGQHQMKKEKLDRLQETVQKLKNEMNSLQNLNLTQDPATGIKMKTLQDQIYEEVDQQKELIVNIQLEQSTNIDKLLTDKLLQSQEQLGLENKVVGFKQDQILVQHSVDRQQVELNFLQKYIQSEQLQIKNVDQQYRDLIKKHQLKLQEDQMRVDQIKSKIEHTQQEYTQNQESLIKQKQVMNEQILERINDSKVQNSIEVQKMQQEIQDSIRELSQALNDKQEAVKTLKNIHTQLKIQVENDTITVMTGDNKDLREKVQDKNDVLQSKDDKHTETENQLEQFEKNIEFLENKEQIHNEFKKGYMFLEYHSNNLVQEQKNIKRLIEDLKRWREESQEKLQIQQQDFNSFDVEMKQFLEEIARQLDQEANKMDHLSGIKSQQELESHMREKLAQIREMEATLRGKDHEIDTLEMIQSQKDSIILELEEQAGKFKEVIKEVHYESQKNDKVEAALFRYLDQHPTKVDMKKLGDGYYKFGSRRIYLKLDNDQVTLLVRVGPKEYITLAMFIIENEGIELQKMGIGKALLGKFHKF